MSELPANDPLLDDFDNTVFEVPSIDGYVIQHCLGQGAFGRVFKAIDTSLSTPVAIKVLNPIASQRQDLRQRFDREIKAYYSVRDSRIIQPRSHGLITQGAFRGCPFVVMEYMDGGSFESWLIDHPANNVCALRVAVEILIQVCEGLSHLHDSKIVHRDLKPANILLAGVAENSDGTPYPKQVRIADFGLAAFLDQSRDLSKTGMGAGTPAYMSPEQFADGKNITPASDQYAIGVILYQLLCSRRPWQSSAEEPEVPGILEAKARSKVPAPPPKSGSSKIDKQLKKICLRCLEPKPEDRYRDMHELAGDLQKWIRGEPIVEPGHPIKWFYHRKVAQPIKRHPGRFLASMLITLLLTIGAGIWWNRYAFHWPYVGYYGSIEERNGVFLGRRPITKNAARNGCEAYKVTRTGRFGPTASVERITKDFGILPSSIQRMIESEPFWKQLAYSYKQNGEIDSVDAFDNRGKALWKKVFTTPDQAKFFIASPEGLQLDQANSSDVAIHKYDWGKTGYLASVKYYDRQGNPAVGPEGGYGLQYTRDSTNEIIEVSYLGPEGQYPMNTKNGFSTIRSSQLGDSLSISYWDQKGTRAESAEGFSYAELLLDKSKRVVNCKLFHADQSNAEVRLAQFGLIGFSFHEIGLHYGNDEDPNRIELRSKEMKDAIEIRFKSNSEGQPISSRFFSDDGRAICLLGLAHGVDWEFSLMTEKRTFVDLDGKPVMGPEGFVTSITRMSSTNKVESEEFYSSDGRRVSAKGVHRIEYRYNSLGAVESKSHFDEKGSLALNEKGFSVVKLEYDSAGRLRSESYAGIDSAPTVMKEGFHKRDLQYDVFGNLIGETYWGIEGTPVLVDGRHRWHAESDSRGNRTLEETFDTSGNRIKNSEGIHLWTAEYDERGRMTKKSYFGQNGEPVLTTDGLHFWTAKYNSAGDQIECKSFGVDSEPVTAWTGYHRQICEYDANGKQILRLLFDIDDTPIAFKEGYYKKESKFDDFGRLLETRTFDSSGRPVIHASGFFCLKITYDSKGLKEKEEHFDVEMKPVLNREGVFRITYEYDEEGRQIGMRAQGTNGEPITAWTGFHYMKDQLDNQGRSLERGFFDEHGNRVSTTEGCHRVVAEYDYRGIAIGASFYGANDQPVFVHEGYHSWKGVFDKFGNQIEGIAYGTHSSALGFLKQPAIAWEGCHRWSQKYDARGNRIAGRGFNTKGKPTLSRDGYFLDTASWDERGNQTSWSFFGLEEEPVMCSDGYHKWLAEYDARKNQKSISYYDVSEQAIENKSGFHRMEREFDRFSRLITERAFGSNNKPCLGEKGFHLKRYRYDSFGRRCGVSYFDTNDRPILSTEGFHRADFQTNVQGDLIQVNFSDTNAIPVCCDDGYHCCRFVVNERGTVVEESYWNTSMDRTRGPEGFSKKTISVDRRQLVNHVRYWDAGDNPTMGPNGVHMESFEYDERGNAVSGRAFNEELSPAEFPFGGHAWKSTFDNRRKQLTFMLYDVDGSPVKGASIHEGYHQLVKEYNPSGNQISAATFGVDGKPVQFRGSHKWRAQYSPTGEQTSMRFYGDDEVAVDCDDGYHSWTLAPVSGEYVFRSVADIQLATVTVMNQVPENSILARIGFREDDVITAVGPRIIDNHLDLEKVLEEAIRGKYGTQPSISVRRGSEEIQLHVHPDLLVGATRTKCFESTP